MYTRNAMPVPPLPADGRLLQMLNKGRYHK